MCNGKNVLEVKSLSVEYGNKTVLHEFNLELQAGQVTAICGPNGSGKSTALSAIRGLIPRKKGHITIYDDVIDSLHETDIAKRLAMLSQTPQAPDNLSVAEIVMMGRYAYRGRFGQCSEQDYLAVDSALEQMELSDLKDRTLATLSGGQCQRTWIALVLAQQSPVILLDEPINHLDLQHCLNTLNHIRRISHEQNKAIAIVLHDLNLAARFADNLVLMKEGKTWAKGKTVDVFTKENIDAVFSVDSEIILAGVKQRLTCIAD